MKLFFDTEFTGLQRNTSLISIGIVDENGRKFYAEFSDYPTGNITPWIKENVIGNLLFNHVNTNKSAMRKDGKAFTFVSKGDTQHIHERLIQWLHFYENDTVTFVSDVSHYDFVLLVDLISPDGALSLPKNIAPACYDINQLMSEKMNISIMDAFNYDREKFVSEYLDSSFSPSKFLGECDNKHNSLYDARIIQTIYDLLMSR